jgi:X-Pro dipeptidyl-peptidase
VHRAAPALLLVPALLAGCLAPGAPLAQDSLLDRLSPPVFKELLKEPLAALAPDGIKLDTFVYRPAVPEGFRVPALVFFSPYYANGDGASRVDNQDKLGGGFNKEAITYFVPRGYAVVLSSTRGTGYSEGCFSIGGPQERLDEAAVIDALIAQPWSNGSVAVLGKSYVGTTANEIILTSHPAVKTVVPISGISDFYKYNFVNGVPINPQGYTFNYYYERDVAIVPPYSSPDEETVRLAADNANCDHSEVQAGGFQSAATGDKTPYWQARDYNADVDKVRAPVFIVHGLQDWNVKPDHLAPWLELLEDRVPTKVWVGQWFHDYPNHNTWKREWSRGDWNGTLLRWFDHWLKGVDTGMLQEPMVDVQDDQGVWRHEARWPPARAANATLYLDAGRLQAAPGSGNSGWQDLGLPIPKPPQAAEAHYALYATEPLAQDLRIAGVGHLHLVLQHTAPRGTVAATLWDVAPNGTATRVNYGYYDLAHRDGLEEGQPVQPGATFELDVPLFPQDDVVLAGHRLALTLAGNDSPVCYYTTVDVPNVPLLPPEVGGVAGLASFACLPADGYDDPGPLMGPLPSGGATTVIHGDGSFLSLPTIDGASEQVFQPVLEYPPS